MKTKSIIIIVLLLIFSGCEYKKSLFPDRKKAFLYFPANLNDIQVSLNGGELFEIKSGVNNQYQVKPGKYEVKIFKNKELIIERNIDVKDGDIEEF